jgi:hypothetical protein
MLLGDSCSGALGENKSTAARWREPCGVVGSMSRLKKSKTKKLKEGKRSAEREVRKHVRSVAQMPQRRLRNFLS